MVRNIINYKIYEYEVIWTTFGKSIVTIIQKCWVDTVKTPSFNLMPTKRLYSQSTGPTVTGLPEFENHIYLVFCGHFGYGPDMRTTIL